MSAKKILVPSDFSQASDAILPLATSIVRDRDAEILFVHVQEPPVAYAAGELYYGPIEPDADALKQMLNRLQPTDPKVPCRHQMLLGEPATEIVRMAEDLGVDMIVMGTHGRSGLARMLMGSVAEKVVRRATCPVLTVKEPRIAK